MNKLPARPEIKFTVVPGECKHEGSRYGVTATIGQIHGHGVSDDKKEAVDRAVRALKRRLQAKRKAMFPVLRYRKGEWRYSFTSKEWGNVYGYGPTPELAFENYKNNLLFLDCLEIDKPSPRRRVPEMDENCIPRDEPKGFCHWLKSLF